ncbi:MAG TPA: class II aldolase/adducin family protein [Clostridia bacterium]|nr:class II aldolase/adducin family protein [Clostridia bacterium]
MSEVREFEGIKFDMCCAARILYRAGLSVANAGHLSVAIGSDRMLVNRFGPSFATLTASDILTVSYDGKILDGEGVVNDTIVLHGIIHRENPDVTAVAHTHPPATVTWSVFRTVPQIYDQESCVLAGDVGVIEEDYEGIDATEDRVMPLARKVGEYRAAILPNHGAVTSGPNIQIATAFMLLLEGMCLRNISVAVAARATGLTPEPIKLEHALTAKREIARIPFLQPLWADFLKRLRQTDPELFS